MRRYAQLTQEERYQIGELRQECYTQKEIAAELGVHPSTISRELRRNRGQRGYRPRQAQQLAEARRKQGQARGGQTRIPLATWATVEAKLREEWSPEQIAGWLARHGVAISHESIYLYILADKDQGGDLHQHLRCQKKRRKRYGSYNRRGLIANRRSISERPAVVERRSRIGDWEADTIIGQSHRQAIVSLAERKSRLVLLCKVEQNTAAAVSQAMTRQLRKVGEKVKTITSDNGREFCCHEEVAQRLGADFFFAHPYSSWERGLNENTNGLVRQYFPKRSSFEPITDADINRVVRKLNHRPRKCLGYRTPYEVFYGLDSVALRI